MADASSLPKVRDLGLTDGGLRRLETLAFRARKVRQAESAAARGGDQRGGRSEFREHRPYAEGDDPRDVDWNVYARTDELHVKVFEAERRTPLTLVVDLSPSMHAVRGKDAFACRLAAALGYVALAGGAPVRLLSAGEPERPAATWHGAGAARAMVDMLERLPATGPVDWLRAATAWGRCLRRPGRSVIVSDFWEDEALRPLAGAVRRGREETTLLQVLTAEETDPAADGPTRLADAETGEIVILDIGPDERAAARAATETHIARVAGAARHHGLAHVLCHADRPFDALLGGTLRTCGLLR